MSPYERVKPPFPYYGGKTRLADAIARMLPEHHHYVEPFAGSLSVLLAKKPSHMETVNDLDEDLVTFWRVLRDRPEDLAAACALTPHSRVENDNAYDLDVPDDVERARRVWVLLSQGRGSTLRRTGWRFYRNPAGSTYSLPHYLGAYTERIPPAAARLIGVSLECRPALEVITDYGQHPNVLLYVDPPYMQATRSSLNYRHEMGGEAEHVELLHALRGCEATVVLSGYPSDLYDEALAAWDRAEMAAWTGNGIRGDAPRTDGARVEVLWCNRELRRAHQGVLL